MLARSIAATKPGPARVCPQHATPLVGGPFLYRCQAGHRVYIAGIQWPASRIRDLIAALVVIGVLYTAVSWLNFAIVSAVIR